MYDDKPVERINLCSDSDSESNSDVVGDQSIDEPSSNESEGSSDFESIEENIDGRNGAAVVDDNGTVPS